MMPITEMGEIPGNERAVPLERRRYPRSGPDEAPDLLWPAVVDIEILDLSLTGVAFSASSELGLGRRVQVRTVLSGAPFAATAEVVRSEVGTQTRRTNRFLVACTFVSLDDTSRKTLGRFLGSER